MQVHPTYLPSVPRIFEKIYTLAQRPALRGGDHGDQRRSAARSSDLEDHGEPVPDELQRALRADAPRGRCSKSRGLFGGSLREAVTGAAPIAKEILEFFYGAGVPVIEGYGMTETATAATTRRPRTTGSARSAARCPASRCKIADDGEILLKGGEHLQRLLQERRRELRRGRRRLAAHRRPRARSTRTATSSITGRKKDIIITAGGKNLTPANLENDLKQYALGLPGRHARRPPARSR